MFQIQNLTKSPKQRQTMVLPDGSQIGFAIFYSSQQQGWFIREITYKNTSFTLRGVRLTNSPCMLYQFRNQIPFGLACISPSGREPMLIDDLSSGATLLYILTAEEVEQYGSFLSG